MSRDTMAHDHDEDRIRERAAELEATRKRPA